jgi:hypothetical protein
MGNEQRGSYPILLPLFSSLLQDVGWGNPDLEFRANDDDNGPMMSRQLARSTTGLAQRISSKDR